MKKIRKPISLLLMFLILFSALTSVSIVSAASVSSVTPLPCVKQNDEHWKNYYYNEGNLYDTACGIFSTVNAVGYLTGQRMSVTEVADWAYSINAFNVIDSEGTYRMVLYPRLEEKYGAVYGFTVDCDTSNTGYWEGSSSDTLKNHLENSGVAIGHVPGHFIAIVGYDREENKFHIYDSYGTSGRGTNTNGGDVWVTQSQLATGQLNLDWFCLLTSTGSTNNPNSSSSLPATYSSGIYMTTNYLNMHSSPSASGDILANIPSNTLVYVKKTSGVWGYATYNNVSGYIRLFYAARVGDLPNSDWDGIGIYKTTSNLNMRSSASAEGSIITTIPLGTSVSVAEILNGWGYTYYNGKTGYINLKYTTRTGSLPYYPGVYQTKSDLNMRSLPSVSGNIVETLSAGTTVSVIYVFDGWGYISYNEKKGYINLSYANRTGDLPKETLYSAGVYETTSELSIRASASASGTYISSVPKGTDIFVTSVSESGWGYTSYNGSYGYVNLNYATPTGDLPESANSTTGIYTVKTDINMRIASAHNSSMVTMIPANTTFYVTTVSGGWGYTKYMNYTGWINLSDATYVAPLITSDDMTTSTDTVGTPRENNSQNTNTSEMVESIEIKKLPDRKFVVGTEYDLSYCLHGMEIKITYSDGTNETYTCKRHDEFSSTFEFSAKCINQGFMIPDLGENVITLSYGGKSVDFTITGLTVENIEITKAPKKTNFTMGQECDIYSCLEGMEIKVGYSDNTERLYTYENDIELFMYELEFSGECFDEDTDNMTPSPPKNIILVIHSHKWAIFTVSDLKVESIEINRLPNNTEFLFGDEYYIYDYLNGMEVKVTYSDKTSRVFIYESENYADRFFIENELQFSGKSMKENGEIITPALGENVIYVHYHDKSTDFTVNGVFRPGDTDGDGKITITDATQIQKFIAGIINFNDEQMRVADLDQDGIITIKDATLVQKFVANIIDSCT